MGHTYSQDLRARIVAAIEEGSSRRAASRQFSVSPSTAIRLKRRMDETGSVAPTPRQARPSRLDPHADWLLGLIGAQPDLTLEAMRQQLHEAHNVKISMGALWNWLDRRGISYKKNTAGQRTRSA